MKNNDILLLGLKRKVTAISRLDGRPLWSTKLPVGGFGAGSDFITVICDDTRVFAYTAGQMHCLDLISGDLLWSNDLPGYGYGIASLCVPGHGSAPDLAAIKQLMAQLDSSAAAASTPAT